MSRELDRPAFYALGGGGVARDLLTLLHPPYTAWHLSYVALGAAAASSFHLDRLGAALGAFLLAVGVAAHALDELHGRPLRTSLSDRTLIALSVVGLAGATVGALPPGRYRIFVELRDGRGAAATGNLPFEIRCRGILHCSAKRGS